MIKAVKLAVVLANLYTVYISPASSTLCVAHLRVSFFIVLILLMEEILHQLRLVVYPIICLQGVYIPGGWEWDFFHQQ